MALTAAQSEAHDELVRRLTDPRRGTALLYGQPASGKSVVAGEVARTLGLDPVRVDVSRERAPLLADVSDSLGVVQRDTVLLILEGLERLNPDNADILDSGRRGSLWLGELEVSADCLVIGIAQHRGPAGAPPSAPWATSFPAQVRLGSVVTIEDQIALLTAEFQRRCAEQLAADENTFNGLDMRHALANPNAAQRFAERVAERCGDRGSIIAAIRDANRLSWSDWLGRVDYRGGAPDYARYERWLQQFPQQVRAAAAAIVGAVVDDYYVDSTAYWSGMRELARATDLPRGSQVLFCRWQDLGESAPQVQRDLKSVARWNVVDEIDLDDRGTWSACGRWPRAAVVAVDDFVGTGTQLREGLEQMAKVISAHPDTQFVLAVLAGFRQGFEHALSVWAEIPENLRIASAMRFDSADSCTHQDSRILDERDRGILSVFSDQLGLQIGSNIVREMGYGGLASLVVLPHFMPNTDLPLIWFDGKPNRFLPLIPRSGWTTPVA